MNVFNTFFLWLDKAPYQVPADAPSIQTVILNQQVVYGTTPVQVRCPNCQKDIITNIHYDTGMLTWISVLVLFLLGLWPCCLIPLCIDALKDVTHTCPAVVTFVDSIKELASCLNLRSLERLVSTM